MDNPVDQASRFLADLDCEGFPFAKGFCGVAQGFAKLTAGNGVALNELKQEQSPHGNQPWFVKKTDAKILHKKTPDMATVIAPGMTRKS